ncbi:hypothetical protein JCM14076_27410 [Methylosoma difficile]
MQKLLLGAAVAAALFGGAANATSFNANGTPNLSAGVTAVVYLSGSSALQEVIERAMLDTSSNSICASGSARKYADAATGGSDQQAYYCNLNAANTSVASYMSATGNSEILLFKRNNGGSLQGVYPVTNAVAIEFLKADAGQTCTTGVADTVFGTRTNCNYAANSAATPNNTTTVPTFGLSDTSANLFTVASENAPTGTPAFTAGYKVTPAVGVTFGIVANTKLRNALQEAQFGVGNACVGSETEACMPNMNSDLIADIFAAYPKPTAPLTVPVKGAGKIRDWTQLKVGASSNLFANASTANKPASSKIHLCTRAIGSGTKAQFNARFLNTVCSTSGVNSVQNADWRGSSESGQTDYSATPILETAVRPIVHAMSSSGGLTECLDELNTGDQTKLAAGSFNPGTAYGSTAATATRWALGYQALDKNASLSSGYRFIKVDGATPTLQNIANGRYPDWVEADYIYRSTTHTTNPLAGNDLNLVKAIITSFTKPTVLSVINTNTANHTFGMSGVLAVPSTTNVAPTTGIVNLASPINPISYAIYPGTTAATQSNACRNPLVYSNNPANNSQGVVLVP